MTIDVRPQRAAATAPPVTGSTSPPPAFTDRGYTGAGGGRASVVPRTPEWRATTVQVAGLWPFCVGASAPTAGVPVGSHYITGAPVHFDPMSWFLRGFITAPIAFVLALNGFGKSSLIRRIVAGAVAAGETVLCMGDTKGEYRDLVERLGGQVVDVGYGHGTINPSMSAPWAPPSTGFPMPISVARLWRGSKRARSTSSPG
ncbi:hypothetical protein [Nocardia sp. MW-W600-9]